MSDLFPMILKHLKALPKCWKHLVLNVALPYGFVGISFIAFVYWNQGIVLGDKSNHVAMFHVPQLFYFVVALSGSLIFQLIFDGRILDLFCFVKRNIAATVICISLVVFFIERFTYEHPFLLSDNRHYTFYIWRRLTPMIRRFLAPLYVAAMIITWRYLAKLKGILFTLGYFACCSLVLVPTPLLEPRYFILPIMFYRMQCCKSYSWLEVLLFSGVNAFTTWMFLYKPFEWPSEPGIKQRFIW